VNSPLFFVATRADKKKADGITDAPGAKEASGDDVGYSDSLYQAADVLIHVKLIKEDKRLYLSIPKVREGIMFSRMSVWAKPAYDFSQAYVEEEGDGEHSEDVGPEEAPIQ
jgi:hypothetical protein